MRVFTYHLSGIHVLLWENKELTTILQFINGISKSCSRFHCNHRAVGTTFDFTFVRLVFFETVCHDSFTGRSSQYIRTQTDDTTRRHIEFQVYTFACTLHLHHLTLTTGYHINNLTGIFFGNIYCQFFNRLTLHTVNLLEDNLWLTNLKLITFATHGFNQYRKMKYTTTGNYPFTIFFTFTYA